MNRRSFLLGCTAIAGAAALSKIPAAGPVVFGIDYAAGADTTIAFRVIEPMSPTAGQLEMLFNGFIERRLMTKAQLRQEFEIVDVSPDGRSVTKQFTRLIEFTDYRQMQDVGA